MSFFNWLDSNLIHHHLLWLTLTLGVYVCSVFLYQSAKQHPLVNPVAIAIASLMAILTISNTDYARYFSSTQTIHFLLGPATVALAIPLFSQLPKLKKIWLPALLSMTIGATIGIFSTYFIAKSLGADLDILLSLIPKAVTTPVAMEISEKINGLPSLSAALVIASGICGALLCSHLFSWFRIHDDSVKGIATGLAAHGIGTARAFNISEEMGAFAGLAMAVSALLHALLIPFLLPFLL